MTEAKLIPHIWDIQYNRATEEILVNNKHVFTKENSGAGKDGAGGAYSKLLSAYTASCHGTTTFISDSAGIDRFIEEMKCT